MPQIESSPSFMVQRRQGSLRLKLAHLLHLLNVYVILNILTAIKEPKKAPAPANKASSAAPEASTSAAPERSIFEEGWLSKLHKPGGNPQVSPKFRDEHLAFTKGKVFTRFPPEPNGFLHIGHSKAIFINFGYAAHHGGHCYLRYDDTNPEAEEARYFESILESIRWLGFEPYKITYSSDYFDELYALAVKLIEKDLAYICHCTGESSLAQSIVVIQLTNSVTELRTGDEINAHRGGATHAERTACTHRTRPTSESLAEFQKMKDGGYRPGEAILRMKQDLSDGNPQMWDLIAYRVLDAPHHRTGTKWKIYPTYDFTHCLVDSFENISYVRFLFPLGFVLTTVADIRCAQLSSSSPASPTNGSATPLKSTNRVNRSTAGSISKAPSCQNGRSKSSCGINTCWTGTTRVFTPSSPCVVEVSHLRRSCSL